MFLLQTGRKMLAFMQILNLFTAGHSTQKAIPPSSTQCNAVLLRRWSQLGVDL